MSTTAMLKEQFDAGLTTRPDFTIDQPVAQYGAIDHAVWQQLYARQTAMLPGRVCDAFMDGIRALDMDAHRVPEFARLNEKLMAATGWQVVAVPGLVPDEVFFDHLANRRFPATWWMR